MTRFRNNGVWSLSLTSVMAVIGVVTGRTDPTLAQIVPDQTLGAEQSQVMPNVDVRGGLADRIDGGAVRGVNLFHSFGEFNVNELQRVYFANPEGIENILGRVTGSNRSDIFGTLGVDGGANLFLINPNGIVFGPNAQLDIRGSFVAGTADRFTFPNGSEFRATNPNAPPLVTVNIPIGLQYGSEPPAALVSEADLEVGRDLALSGGSVTSTGHLSAPEGLVVVEGVAGDVQVQDVTAQSATLYSSQVLSLEENQLRTTGDLNLLADQTVRVRDSVQKPFLALSGGNLLVQGNESVDILALNHPQTPFQSMGSLTLVSDGNVSGDAHFYSGGNFSILNLAGEPGTFVSLYDPIISVDGNVTFGDYEGVALKVEATGSIRTGNITITGPDTGLSQSATRGNFAPTATEGTFIGSTGTGSVSASELESFLALTSGDLSQAPFSNGLATEGSALTTTFTTTVSDQEISFDWLFSTGEGVSSNFNDFAFVTLAQVVNAPDVPPDAPPDAPFDLVTLADTALSPGTGGIQTFTIADVGTYTLGIGVVDVSDTSVDSNIQVSNFSLSDPDNPGNTIALDVTPSNDPDIPTLASSPALILRAGLTELSNQPNLPQNQGGTTFTDPGGPLAGTILVEGNINTSTTTSGGPVILSATSDITVEGGINSSSSAGNGGSIDITSSGGSITVRATDPKNPVSVDTSSEVGSGGNITLIANAGTATIENADFRSDTNGAGSAGNIEIEASQISLLNSTLSATLGNGSSGFDTQIFLFNNAGILPGIAQNDDSNPADGADGSVGLPFNPELTRDSYLTYEFTTPGTYYLGVGAFPSQIGSGEPNRPLSGNALSSGEYSLQVSLNLPPDSVSDDRTPTPLPEVEPNNAISQAQSIDSGLALGDNPNVENSDTIPFVSIAGSGDNTFDYYSFIIPDSTDGTVQGIFDIDTNVATAGQISLTSTGLIELEGSQIDASTFGRGDGGSVIVTSDERVSLDNGSSIRTTVGQGAEGSGGNVEVRARQIDLAGGSSLNAGNDGLGRGGNVVVSGTEGISLSDSSSMRTTVGETGQGQGGDIEITTPSLSVIGGSRLEAQTLGVQTSATRTAQAGNITVNAQGGVVELSGANDSGFVSGLFTSTEKTESGRGGNITVNTDLLTLSDRAVMSARTRNDENSGFILANVDTLQVRSGAQMITTADAGSSGRAGDITVNAANGIELSGSALPFPLPTSPFAGVGVESLNNFDTCGAPDCNLNVELADRIPFFPVGEVAGNGEFRYYSFTIRTAGGRGIFDIDNGYKLNEGNTTDSSVDTQLFLFNADTGELLANNDDSFTNQGAGGSIGLFLNPPTPPTLPSISRDSYIRYNFSSPGTYILAVAQFPTEPIGFDPTFIGPFPENTLTPIAEGRTYTLNVSVQGQGSLDGLNPNQGLNSGLYAQSLGTGNGGLVTLNTRQVTVQDGAEISASTTSGVGQGIVLEGLEKLEVQNGSQIEARTDTGQAGNLSVNLNTPAAVSVQVSENSQLSVAATGADANSTSGLVTINTRALTVEEGSSISASTEAGQGEGIQLQNLEALNVLNNSQIEATTNTGQAGNLSVNLDGQAAASALVSGNSELSVAARGDNADSESGLITINTSELTVEDGSRVSASTEAGQGEGIQLQNLEALNVLNNSQIEATTNTGQAGNLSVNLDGQAAESALVSGNSELSVAATGSNTNSESGLITINTRELTVEDGSTISAATNAGQGRGVQLQNMERLSVNNSLISSSTISGVAGDVIIDASDSVTLSGTFTPSPGSEPQGGVVAAATAGGRSGSVTINTGDLLIRDGAEVSVSSPSGIAGNVNVNADFIGLNQGSITAEAGQGEGGANIDLNASGFLRLDNESLISALATGNATGGNININAQYVIASFPTGSEGSDIVANAELGNGGQITINALGIFGLEFRPAQTPLNDITASSQGGAAGTVQITTLGIDPSRGLAALPLNFIDVSGLVGGQCSASGADGELSQFTIIGRGGLPLNPTDPLAPEAEASDWVTFDPESDRISPQAHTPIRITPFTSSVSPQQLAQFPSLCYQSWSTSAIAP